MKKIKTNEQFNPDEKPVYPAWQAATLAESLARTLSSNEAIRVTTGLAGVDRYLNPMVAGTLVTVLGRPQNAKSFISDYLIRTTIEDIIANGKSNEQVVILISTEVSVEITALKWMARFSKVPLSKVLRGECDSDDLDKLTDASYQVMGLPLIIIGHSSERSKDNKRVRPLLTTDSINDAIEYIFNEYKNPTTRGFIDPKLIVTDYLQLLHKPTDYYGSDRMFYVGCMRWAKDVALWGGCTHIMNVQARREVDDRDIKIPRIGDGMETAAIEQFTDIMFSTHMPKVYNTKQMPELKGWNLPEVSVTDDMIYLALLKQKDGPANKAWILKADFQNLDLVEYDNRTLNHH